MGGRYTIQDRHAASERRANTAAANTKRSVVTTKTRQKPSVKPANIVHPKPPAVTPTAVSSVTIFGVLPPPPVTIPTREEITVRRKIEKINYNRLCVINQPDNLCHILFCEPLVKAYYQDGYKIIWPVEPELCWLNKHFPYITFINKNFLPVPYDYAWFYNSDSVLMLPLQWSHKIMQQPTQVMSSKYSLFNMPAESWSTIVWNRDIQAEDELMEILQIELDEQYNLINGSDIDPSNGLRNIYVDVISDFTIFDWTKVIQHATNIFTANGVFNYIAHKEKVNKNVTYLPAERDVTFQF